MSKYQHYRGGIYKLLSTSVYHTETNERLAVYEDSKGKVFARPYNMFFENVSVDGVEVPRFKEIKPKKATLSQKEFRDMLDCPKPKENYMDNILKKYGRN